MPPPPCTPALSVRPRRLRPSRGRAVGQCRAGLHTRRTCRPSCPTGAARGNYTHVGFFKKIKFLASYDIYSTCKDLSIDVSTRMRALF